MHVRIAAAAAPEAVAPPLILVTPASPAPLADALRRLIGRLGPEGAFTNALLLRLMRDGYRMRDIQREITAQADAGLIRRDARGCYCLTA